MFVSGRSGPFLDQFLAQNGHTTGLPRKDGGGYVDAIGKVLIIPYGPGHSDVALHIPFCDPGHIKYEPLHALLCLFLHYLLLVTLTVLKMVVSSKLSHSPIPWNLEEATLGWLQGCKDCANSILKQAGIEDAITEVCQKLKRQESMIRILQQNASIKQGATCASGPCLQKNTAVDWLPLQITAPKGQPQLEQLAEI